MRYKLIAMDLDGTLTQHRTKLTLQNRIVLDRLKKHYSLVMVVAGSCQRVFDQMDHYSVDIIGNYGLQESVVVNGILEYVRNEKYGVDKQDFIDKIHEIRNRYGYTDYSGKSVEFHESGVVTFPLLGTTAKIQDKIKFDPNGSKRSCMYGYVSSQFSDYNCFIGGSSSFDIVSKKYDKANALMNYCLDKEIRPDEVLYLGDDFKKGGNDEPIANSSFDYLPVDDYSCLDSILEKEGIL